MATLDGMAALVTGDVLTFVRQLATIAK